MKITKNTSGYAARDLRRVICKVHSYMKTLEGKAAPNWRRLKIHVRSRPRNYHTGRAFLGGHGYRGSWDVIFTIPANGETERKFGWLVYHELMHTYGYHHSQYTNIPADELETLFPDNANILKPEPAPKVDHVAKRYAALVKRRATWQSKLNRAQVAHAKVEREVRAYESRHGERLTA